MKNNSIGFNSKAQIEVELEGQIPKAREWDVWLIVGWGIFIGGIGLGFLIFGQVWSALTQAVLGLWMVTYGLKEREFRREKRINNMMAVHISKLLIERGIKEGTFEINGNGGLKIKSITNEENIPVA